MSHHATSYHPLTPAAPREHLPATPDERADMRPCRVCGSTDRTRMHALMTIWFGHHAGVPLDHGYFYLCPSCFSLYIPVAPPAQPEEEGPSRP
jgi:hypothetical protein